MTKGSNLKKRRQSGFRNRMKTVSGKKVIKGRRSKKRNRIGL